MIEEIRYMWIVVGFLSTVIASMVIWTVVYWYCERRFDGRAT